MRAGLRLIFGKGNHTLIVHTARIPTAYYVMTITNQHIFVIFTSFVSMGQQ